MDRHTTRGGWKPPRHERILKPEFPKGDIECSAPFQRKFGTAANQGAQYYDETGREKLG